jgi:glutamate racemase
MRIALINSGLGLLAPAAALHRMRPDADLILAPDPDGMPWGPRSPENIAARALVCARAAVKFQPDVIVMACNTGSVHALEPLRAEFEPGIPVIGTVPAIKPAAAAHHRVAIWATVATTASAYQRRLIAEFAGSADVTAVACPGLADAVDAGDEEATDAAIAAAAAQTPPGCEALVLGCTEYELAAGRISRAVPGAVMMGSAVAVAAQALRRIAARTTEPAAAPPPPELLLPPACRSGPARLGTVRVLLSGRPAALPPAALRYPEGRMLAPLLVPEDVADVSRPAHHSGPSRVSPPPAAGAVIGC